MLDINIISDLAPPPLHTVVQTVRGRPALAGLRADSKQMFDKITQAEAGMEKTLVFVYFERMSLSVLVLRPFDFLFC